MNTSKAPSKKKRVGTTKRRQLSLPFDLRSAHDLLVAIRQSECRASETAAETKTVRLESGEKGLAGAARRKEAASTEEFTFANYAPRKSKIS